MNNLDENCTFCKRPRVEHEIGTYRALCHQCKLMFKHADKQHCLVCNQPEHMMHHRYLSYAYFDMDDIDIFEYQLPREPSYYEYKICYRCAELKLGIKISPEMWSNGI